MDQIIDRWKRVILVALVVGVVAAAYGFGRAHSTIVEFNHRLALAEQHAPAIRRKLDADGRFAGVYVESFTGYGGCLLISGEARSETVADLRRIVFEEDPPVPVRFRIDRPLSASRPVKMTPATAGIIPPD